MKELEYRERLANNKLRDHVLPLFEILEKHVDNKTDYTLYLLDEISDLLNNDELKMHISEIGKEARKGKSSILSTYVLSLQRNIADYIKMNDSEQIVRKVKLKKLLYSYINVTRYVIDYDTLENLINRGPQNGEKIVLALGLIKVEDDDIKVNEEIQFMVDSSRMTNNYFVIPIYGCSTNVFASINRKVHANIVHIAGHGINENGRKAICFVDANMTFPKLCEKLAMRREMVFLNCCNTYEYVEGNTIPVSDCSIVHEGSVIANVAYEFSERFYNELWRTEDLLRAWDVARTVEDPLKYHLL